MLPPAPASRQVAIEDQSHGFLWLHSQTASRTGAIRDEPAHGTAERYVGGTSAKIRAGTRETGLDIRAELRLGP